MITTLYRPEKGRWNRHTNVRKATSPIQGLYTVGQSKDFEFLVSSADGRDKGERDTGHFLLISHSATNYNTGRQCVACGKCFGRAGECQPELGGCRPLTISHSTCFIFGVSSRTLDSSSRQPNSSGRWLNCLTVKGSCEPGIP